MNNNHDSRINNYELKEVIYKTVDNGGTLQQMKPTSTRKNDTFFLYFCVLTANTLMFMFGSSLVWTSPVIPQLRSNNTDINPLGDPITTGQISLLAGLPSLFMIFGPLLFGKLADVIGRKNTLLCISLVILIANVAVAFGGHIFVFYIGRSMTTLCLGLLLGVLPIYLNEICEDHNRAKHGCLMMSFIPLGNLYGFLLGPLTNVKLFTLLCAVPLIPQLIFFCLFVPESPFYTASKGNKEKTIETLKKLRSNKSLEEIENDFKQIEIILRSRAKADVGGLKKLFETRALRMGLIIGMGSYMATHLSGVPVIMGFLGPIFNDAGSNMSGNTVAILVGLVTLFFYFVTMTIVGRFGNRLLLLVSTIGTAIPLAILAVYFYLHETDSSVIESIKWLPVVCILVSIAFYSMGLGSIPITVMSELFPNDLRASATSLILTIVGIFAFLLSSAFPIVSELLGVHFCIGTFSAGCFLAFIFMYFLLPETQGKSFLEIQEILSR